MFLDISNDKQIFTGVIWDNGDYILELSGNLAKNDLLNLAYSAKVLENKKAHNPFSQKEFIYRGRKTSNKVEGREIS